MRLSDVLIGLGHAVSYYPALCPLLGGVQPTLFFCNLALWKGKEGSQSGEIYKTQEAITAETGLTRNEQETARTALRKKGLLTERYARLEHRMYYTVHLDILNSLWDNVYANIPESGKPTFGNVENQHSACANTGASNLRNPESDTEITTETPDPPKAPLVGGMCTEVIDVHHDTRAVVISPQQETVVNKQSPKPLRSKINTAYTPGFLDWWAVYPPQRRLDKPACFVVWQREQLELRAPELTFKIMRLKETTWKHAESHHIKTTLPYLNSGRYEDDLVPLPDIPAREDTGMSEKSYQTALAITNLAAKRRANNGEHHGELRSVPTGTRQIE